MNPRLNLGFAGVFCLKVLLTLCNMLQIICNFGLLVIYLHYQQTTN